MELFDEKNWWLRFEDDKDKVQPQCRVEKFDLREAAEAKIFSLTVQREYGMSNRVTTAFQADSKEDALSKMNRY